MKSPLRAQFLAREEIQHVAERIYVYGYPLLLMDATKRTQTATPSPTSDSAPLNQFVHQRFILPSHEKHIIHANVDCLRSFAWVDLGKEPVVLSVPRYSRYYLLSFFSGWYEIFASHSPRNAGTQDAHLGFVAPHWRGRLPVGVKRVVAPTQTVLIEGSVQVGGVEDAELLHRMQDQLRLTRVSEWEGAAATHKLPFRADIDHKSTPQEQVADLDARDFYTRLAGLLQRNPMQKCDIGLIGEFARIGFLPGEDFAFEMLPSTTTQVMHEAVVSAQNMIAEAGTNLRRKVVNNWILHYHPGFFLQSYLERAAAAHSGLFSALAEDVLLFETAVDQTNSPLSGLNQYVIDFKADLVPPVNAFWSITLYDASQHLVPNNLHRNIIGDSGRLRRNADGSLSVFIQHDWPGTNKDSNWLLAPKGTFRLALRMYWPKSEVVAGNWHPPAVIRTNY